MFVLVAECKSSDRTRKSCLAAKPGTEDGVYEAVECHVMKVPARFF